MRTKPKNGRIFINYRRSDTRGVAGRLADSLEDYFGDNRVFRDVEDIEGGANFEEVLRTTVNAADAVIVLIGPAWLAPDGAEGKPRLQDPKDWVAREIAGALARDIPVFPVLIENTPMPSPDELPDELKPLCLQNATSLSDDRWTHDVTRLAKMVALDIPGSVAEKRLDLIRLIASLCLLLSLLLSALFIFTRSNSAQRHALQNLTIYDESAGNFAGDKDLTKELGPALAAKLDKVRKEERIRLDLSGNRLELEVRPVPIDRFVVITYLQTGLPYIFILIAAILLLVFANLVDLEKRRLVYAAGITGLVGTLVSFSLIAPAPTYLEPLVAYFFSVLIAGAMFVLMVQSGLKPK